MTDFYFVEPTQWKIRKSFWQEILPREGGISVFQGCRDDLCATGLIIREPMKGEVEKLKNFGKWVEKHYKKSKCEVRKYAKGNDVALVCFVRRNDLLSAWIDMLDFADKLNIERAIPLSEDQTL